MRNVVHRFPNLGTGSPFGKGLINPKRWKRGKCGNGALLPAPPTADYRKEMGLGGSEEMPPPPTANYRQEMGREGSGETGPFPPPLRLAFSPFFSFATGFLLLPL